MGCISDTGHRFVMQGGDTFDWDVGRFHVTVPCGEVEIRGSQYSERHDEVFYDEGPSCEAFLNVTYCVDEVVTEDGMSLGMGAYEDFVHEEAGELESGAIDEILRHIGEEVEADDFPQEFTVTVKNATGTRYAPYEYEAHFVREYTEVNE